MRLKKRVALLEKRISALEKREQERMLQADIVTLRKIASEEIKKVFSSDCDTQIAL